MKYAFYPGCTLKSAAGYEESIKFTLEALDLSIPEVEDWNCCGATAYFSLEELTALVLPARVMAIAEAMGAEIITTPCNACYATLRKARYILSEDEGLKEKVNKALAEEDKRYRGKVKVKHLLDYYLDPEILPLWREKIIHPLKTFKVAPYYGCQYSRPQVEDEDHPERPQALDRFLETIGCQVVDFSSRTACCGAAQMVAHEKACEPLVKRILTDAKQKGAHFIAAICPLCQFNLDAPQERLHIEKIPVVYFTQLLGIAMGIGEKKLGLSKLLVPFKGTP